MKSKPNRHFFFYFSIILAFLALVAQVWAAPSITTQPAQRQVVPTKGNATIRVAASGNGAISYQWYHNGLAVPGATLPSLALSNLKYADAGAYQVKVTDSTGVTTSAAGFLNVLLQSASVAAWGDNSYGQSNVPSGLSSISALAEGGSHGLALKPDGTVVAWGRNASGESNVPTGLSGVVAIAAGYSHSLALKSDGTVVAWGLNTSGQCTVPTGLSGVVAIAAGYSHSLALKSDGSVVAWGNNSYGQKTVPTGLSGIVAIAAGDYHSLALKSDGTVAAWGQPYYGQTSVPTGLTGVVAIAGESSQSFALKSDGTVAAWGINLYGESTVPTGLSGVVAIAAGNFHTLALKSDGTVVTWGYNNAGQCSVPVGVSNVAAVTAGYLHSMALQEVLSPALSAQPASVTVNTGEYATFSVNATGILLSYQWRKDGVNISGGTRASYTVSNATAADEGGYDVIVSNPAGTVTSNLATLTVVGPTLITQPAQSQVVAEEGDVTFSVAATGNGDLSYQWFHNGLAIEGGTFSSLTLSDVKSADAGVYQVKVTDSIGVATSTAGFLNVSQEPAAVVAWGLNGSGQCSVPSGLSGVIALAGGSAHSLALRSDGTIVAWGSNASGESTVPSGLSGIVALAAGGAHSLALRSDGTVWAWGSNTSGESTVPSGLSGIIAVAAGGNHSLALRSDGTVCAWGENASGESTVPLGLSGVIAIAAGGAHSLALKSDGSVVAWGSNGSGESTVPSGLSGVIAIAAGGHHSLALKSDGTVAVWGSNNYGESTVPPGLSGVVSVTAGGSHCLTLKSDGTAVAWGSNTNGESIVPTGVNGLLAIAAGDSHNLVLQKVVEPTLSAQPLSVTVNTGEYATFNVSATGILLSYQWRKNGTPIASGTGASYTLSNAQKADEGSYDVIVSNPAGTVTSGSATLTVVGPSFALQPEQRKVVTCGGNTTFSVSVTGSGGLSYQWLHNGLAVAGGTSYSLTLSNVQYADTGAYQVKVTDSTGVATSSAGFLNILVEPSTVIAWGKNDYGQSSVPTSLNGVIAIAGGGSHSLALQSDGTVIAWGYNYYGQSAVPTGLSGIVAIAAGDVHSLALKSDGTVVAWGSNLYGETSVPAGLGGVIAIGAKGFHNLALKSDGTVVAWGDMGFGESNVPAGLSGVVAIAAGGEHSLALKSDGTVVAWGSNGSGESTVPLGLTGVVAIAAGREHSIALKSDGTVVAWGRTVAGESTVLSGLGGVIAIAEGAYHSLALKSDGTVVAWGDDSYGQSDVPAGLTNATAIAGGYSHGLALQAVVQPTVLTQPASATVKIGENATFSVTAAGGTLSYQWRKDGVPISGGTGSAYTVSSALRADQGTYDVVVSTPVGTVTSDSATLTVLGPTITTQPVQRQVAATGGTATFSVAAIGTGDMSYQWFHNGLAVAGGTFSALTLNNVKYADAGAYQVKISNCGVVATSTVEFLNVLDPSVVVAWGDNSYGQCTVPSALSGVVAVAAGWYHNLALKSDGTVIAWGWNNNGQTAVPSGLSDVVAIGAGYAYSVALKSDGTVVAWGDNSYNQCAVPAGLNGVVAIAAAYSHTVALKSDGTVVAWGQYTTSSGVNVVPAGLSGVVAVAAGDNHNLALKSDGTVVAWGDNYFGECTIPAGLSAVAIAAADYHSLALKADGSVAAWGDNTYGRNNVPNGLSGAVTISDGCFSCYALKSDGNIIAWGDNSYPVPVGLTGVVALAEGSWHRLALREMLKPAVTVQPVSVTVKPGEAASFNVTATGDQLCYQWRKDGVPISSGTGASYTVPNAQWSDEGTYDVIVSNLAGTAMSTDATLAVAGPILTNQPEQGQVITNGGNVTISASAIGRGDIIYHWFHNGLAVVGGTSSSLTLSNVKYADSGAYQVKVTDSTGTVTSNAGFLNVIMESQPVVAWGSNGSGESNVPAGLSDVTAIAAGGAYSLVLKSDGTVVAWGDNSMGQCNVPSSLSDVVALAAKGGHSLALKSDGTVVAWGRNGSGENNVPAGLSGVIAIAAGGTHSLALKSDGTVVAWGDNFFGQSTVPAGLSGVIAIAAGDRHSVALKSDGGLVSWGYDVYGLGTVPSVIGITGVAIAAGKDYSMVLESDGTVIAWGDTSFGGTTAPVGLSGVVAIAAGDAHSIALKSDGTVVAWGDNSYSQSTVPAGLDSAVAIAAGGSHSLALQGQLPPAPPTNVNASDNDLLCAGKVHVTWTAVTGANAYRVFRATSATGFQETISGWQSSNSFYDTTAIRGAVYYYWIVAATDASGTNVSGYSAYDTGSAALTASDVFSSWMVAHGVNGVPESGFAADRDGDGVPNGLEYAFAANRKSGQPPILVTAANGTFLVGVIKQADETLAYVDLAVKCSTDLSDWSYPLVPATDSTGLDVNRTWYQPQGSPAKVFFRLEATLKPAP